MTSMTSTSSLLKFLSFATQIFLFTIPAGANQTADQAAESERILKNIRAFDAPLQVLREPKTSMWAIMSIIPKREAGIKTMVPWFRL